MEQNKRSQVVMLGGLGLVVLFLMTWYWNKGKPFAYTIRNFLYLLLFLAVIGLIVAGLIYIFKKTTLDMIHTMKMRVQQACEIGAFQTPKPLMLIGYQKEEGVKMALQEMAKKGLIDIKSTALMQEVMMPIESRYIGYVTGMCQVQTEPLYKDITDEDGNIIERELIRKPMKATLLSYRSSLSAINKFFVEPQIFLCYDGDFSDLNGDVINLYDMAVTPSLYGFLVLARHYRDTNKIDEVAKELIQRYVTQENLKNLGSLLEASYAISEKYKNEREQSILKDFKEQSKEAKSK